MKNISFRRARMAVATSIALGGVAAVTAAGAQTRDGEEISIDAPGSVSALVFNEIFNVGGVAADRVSDFRGSVGCGGTDNGGAGGGASLSNVLNAALDTGQYSDDAEVENNSNRSLARNLWRLCDNLYNGGAWTVFTIDVVEERLQSAGMAPDELFAQMDQAAAITRAQVRSVGSRAKQMRLAALGYGREAMLADNGAVSLDVRNGTLELDIETGLNASDEDPVTEGGAPLSIWANIRYVDVDADTTPAEIGSSSDGIGAVVGVDYQFSGSFIGGVSLSITNLDTEFDPIMGSPSGESDVENTALQFVWSYFPNDELYVNGVFGISDLDFDNTKYVPAFDLEEPGATPFAPLDSSPGGDTLFANVLLGRDFRKEAATISPYARLEYLDTEIDGFVEQSRDEDDTLSLTVLAQSNTSITGTLGAQVSFPRSTASGIWAPYVRAELVHEFEDQSDFLRGFLTIVPEAEFVLAPTETDEQYGFLGFGIGGQLANGWALFADYDTLFGYDSLDSWQATFGFRKEL